jgi:UDP-2,4-diacetamido-2,4,6-trideoxy-beta-L-altropyranose hydrolase
MSPQQILIRADATTQMGQGHIMRQIAFSQYLTEGGFNVHFATASPAPIESRIKKEPVTLHSLKNQNDTDTVIQLARKLKCKWISLDGYHFTYEVQKQLKESGFKLISFDDIAPHPFLSDIIINQNSTDKTLYKTSPNSVLFCGPQYAMLRKEFRKAIQTHKMQLSDHATNIVITLGGGDPENHTSRILKSLAKSTLPNLHVHAIIGSINPHKVTLENNIQALPFTCQLSQNLNTELLNVMKWADIAITASGTTVWEWASLGTPLINLTLFDNQKYISDTLSKAEASIECQESDIDTIHKHVEALSRNLKIRENLSHNLRLLQSSKVHEILNRIQEET